jgi:hypothetical protein
LAACQLICENNIFCTAVQYKSSEKNCVTLKEEAFILGDELNSDYDCYTRVPAEKRTYVKEAGYCKLLPSGLKEPRNKRGIPGATNADLCKKVCDQQEDTCWGYQFTDIFASDRKQLAITADAAYVPTIQE